MMAFHPMYSLLYVGVPTSVVFAMQQTMRITVGTRAMDQNLMIAALTSGDPGEGDNDDFVGGPRGMAQSSTDLRSEASSANDSGILHVNETTEARSDSNSSTPLDGKGSSETELNISGVGSVALDGNGSSESGVNISHPLSLWNSWADYFVPRCRWSEEFDWKNFGQTPGKDCVIPEPVETWDPWRGGESRPHKFYTKIQRCPAHAAPLMDSAQASQPRRILRKEKEGPRGQARWPESKLCSPEDLLLYLRTTQNNSSTHSVQKESVVGKSVSKQQPKFATFQYRDLANTTVPYDKEKNELHPIADFLVVCILSWLAYAIGYEHKVNVSQRLDRERCKTKKSRERSACEKVFTCACDGY